MTSRGQSENVNNAKKKKILIAVTLATNIQSVEVSDPQKQQFYPQPETNHQLLLWRTSSAFIRDYPRLFLLFSWRENIPELFWSHLTAGPIMAPPACAERRSGHQLCFCLSVGGDIFTITGATFQRNKENICLTEGGTVGPVVPS